MRLVRRNPVASELDRVFSWYATNVYGVLEGPGVVPFYCDPRRVGHFATPPDDLARGDEAALFKLLITLAMFQGVRDVNVMRHQRALNLTTVKRLTNLNVVRLRTQGNYCHALSANSALRRDCSVRKMGTTITCDRHPARPCHVKEATVSFNRMGDMGKLPTSAWLALWRQSGGLQAIRLEVLREEGSPERRGRLLVKRIADVHRVGEKLATMYVSALSTPALSPNLTPWFPDVDGNHLVVVDTNVACAVDLLRRPGKPTTQLDRQRWIAQQARRLDLRRFHPDLPKYSPRLLQQSLYWFCSESNRRSKNDGCATLGRACRDCARTLCPFARASTLA